MGSNLVAAAASFLWMFAAVAGPAQSPPQAQPDSAGAKATDVESAISLLCKPGDILRSKSGAVSGCRACPEGTDFHAEIQSNWDLNAATFGHFTSPQDHNLLVSGSGCDSHANNFGGNFVFTFQSGKPTLIRYDNGLLTDQCHKFDFADGRNFLVCRGGWSGQGMNSENVFMVSFAPDGKETVDFLISTNDSTGTCDEDPSAMVRESKIAGLRFDPRDSGSIASLTVTATLGRIPCSEAGKPIRTGKWAEAVKSYAIEFYFDGRRFRPTPASLPAFHKFEKN